LKYLYVQYKQRKEHEMNAIWLIAIYFT
jgi:hypothetical protein